MTTIPRRILVPLDGSGLAESAVPAAVEIAAAWGAAITFLHILEARPPDTVHGDPHLAGLEEARSYLEGWAEKLRRSGTPVDIHAHGPGVKNVAEALAGHAEEIQADLIVLCAHGSGGWRDILLGNIAQQTLKRCVRPVLLVRAPAPDGGWRLGNRPWVVAIDPAFAGSGALRLVTSLGGALRAQLRLLTVVPTRGTLPQPRRAEARVAPTAVAALLDLEARDAHGLLEELADELREVVGDVVVDVTRGDPVGETLASVNRSGAALLIVRTHRKAGVAGLVSGSFAAACVARTDCPVLLVPIESEPATAKT